MLPADSGVSSGTMTQNGESVKGKFSLDEAYRKAVSSGNVQERRNTLAGQNAQTAEDGKVSNSIEDYKKPITEQDVEVLRSIGRKSVNEFTGADLQKAGKWAYKFYQELGTKSPFFRAWFGDWRANDTSTVKAAQIQTLDISNAIMERGTFTVDDTGWTVYAGTVLQGETKHSARGERISEKALSSIKEILSNAILLDTEVSSKSSNKKSKWTAFMHKLYTPITYDGRNYIAKIAIEEFYNEGTQRVQRRAYQLQSIKIEPVGGSYVENSTTTPRSDTGSIRNVSDLYALVKQYDKDFTAAHEVHPALLNADGTPKKWYHSTNADFTTFKQGSGVLGDGIYFSDYAQRLYGKNTKEVYLNVENPINLRALPNGARNVNSSGIETSVISNFFEKFPQYDAIVDSRHGEIVVKSPTQIKSATDNIGTFERNNPDIRYSLDTDHYDYSRSFAQQIDDYVAGKFPRNDTFVLGKTPDIFQKVGLSALPMTMDQIHVDYALNGTKNADHQLGADLLKNLPSLLEKPVAIIESATHPDNSVMAIVKGEVNGKQVTAAVRVGGTGRQNGVIIDSNHLVSVQGRQNAVSKLLVQAMEKENAGETGVYYINKTEAQDLCARAGLQLPGSAAQDGLIHSIFDAGSPVNRKYVEQTETRQFKRWFGDWQNDPAHASKVVNEDGTPKVMYHGTSKGGFNVFNTYGSNFGLFGVGSYFTDNPDVAQSYTQKGKGNNPQVYAVYLDIRNPIDMDADANVSEWKKTLRDASSYFNGCKTNEDCFKALKEYCQDEMMYKYEAEEYITDAIKAMGYDGITHIGGGRHNKNDATRHRVFIAFDPEQIKSATDNIGTFDRNNPDIRYSLDTEQLEKTVRAIDTKALEEGLQSMTLTSNVNSFTMKARFFDAISKGNESLRNELHDIFEKPHSEATGLYARNLEKMQERVKNIAKEAGVLSKDGKKFDKAASAAVQNIGEGIAPIACSVEAKVVEADTISLKATRNDSEILSGDFTLEAQFFGIWKRLVERQSNIKPLPWERLLPEYRRIL